MRALSVRQPFAEALVRGPGELWWKDVENRKARFPSTVPLPAWVAIHAGSAPFADVSNGQSADDACELVLRRLQLWEPTAGLKGRAATRAVLPFGRIVGAVRFVASVQRHELDAFRVWASGPWCWVADRAVRIHDGPEIKGKLGLWHLPPSVAEVVEAAILEQYGDEFAAWEQ